MIYADSITKKFLNYANPGDTSPGSPIIDHQDPTYLGFYFELVTSLNTQDDYDDLPHGLFTDDPIKNEYSTYNYLRNRGEYLRASYILAFEKDFKALVKECPWYFIKVSGLADSWKIDPKNNFRGKDKKITIETLESIDMKVTYMMDLYRKAVFDAAWMRYAVPDHMRYFRMNITVAEIRPMKIGTRALNSSADGGIGLIYDIDSSNLKNTIDEMQTAQNNQPGLYDTTAPWSAGTFIRFKYSQCELDVFNESPAFLENLGMSPTEAASNKIVIKTNYIEEKNVYGLLGAILQDTSSVKNYGKAQRDLSIFAPNSANSSRDDGGEGGNTGVPDYEKYNKTTVPSYKEGLDQRAANQGSFGFNQQAISSDGKTSLTEVQKNWDKNHNSAGSTTPDSPLKAAIKQVVRNLEAGAKDYITSAVKEKLNSVLLGNVYNFSPLTIAGELQSIANNPADTVQKLLSKYSSPNLAKRLQKSVEFTGEEIILIAAALGNVGFFSNTPAQPSTLGNDNLSGPAVSLGDPIAGHGDMSGNNISAFATAGTIPPITFESAPLPPSDLPKNVYK